MSPGHEMPVSQIGYDAAAKRSGRLWTGVRSLHCSPHVHPTLAISCEGRTTLPCFPMTLAHDDASIRLRPPLVSCIALLDGVAHSPDRLAAVAGDARWPRCRRDGNANLARHTAQKSRNGTKLARRTWRSEIQRNAPR